VYFEPRHLERTLYGGVFDAPAVAKGAPPFLLTVRDHNQLERLPHIVGGGQFPRTILGEHIAADIVQHWSQGALGMTPDSHPGVWVVRDVVVIYDETGTPLKDVFGAVQTRPATQEEKDAMWQEDLAANTAAQNRWADYLIGQGDVLDGDPNPAMKLLISHLMRSACKYRSRDRGWLQELKDSDAKTCVFCLKSLDARAVVCEHCHNVVDREAYDRLTAASKPSGPNTPSTPTKPTLPPPIQAPGKQHAA
jgi:hypothetical protein